MSRGRSTLRRMIISGSERAITDIMNASAVPSAAPSSSSACTPGTIPAAFFDCVDAVRAAERSNCAAGA